MQWQRLTVFRDAPNPEHLRSVLQEPCRLFRSHSTGAYFLEPGDKHNKERPMLGGYYESPFRLTGTCDPEALKAFEAANAGHKQSFHIHYEIVREAILASRLFQTEVLSSYSNDEDDDFVAVAKNGELTHLRFEGYRKVIRTLSPDEAAGTETEFHAVRMDPPGKTVEDEPVCEYEAYEARMSPETELGWYPYSRYIEGELNGQVILRNLTQNPSDVPGQLMFRMAHLEFRNLFGGLIPDPYAETDDYELVADYVPPDASRLRKIVPMFSGLILGLFYGILAGLVVLTKKNWKYLLALLVLVVLGLLSSALPPSERDIRTFKFADHCRQLDGRLEKRGGYSGSTGGDHCRIGDLVYLEHELPGQAGDVRRMAGTLENKACEDGAEPSCLHFNGVRLNGPVTKADIAAGDRVLTALRRTQVCDYRPTLVCEDGRAVFVYEVGTMFSLEPEE